MSRFLFHICLVGIFVISSAFSAIAAPKVVELKISHIATEVDPIHMGWSFLKKTLEEKSGGSIKVTIFPNKVLSNSNNEDVEKVQQNIVQMTSVPTSSLAAIGNIKEYKVFDYAYLLDNNEETYKVIDGPIGKELSAVLEKKVGVKALGGYNLGWLVVSSNKAPIKSPADLKGQKIRTMSSDLQMEIIRAFGGNPVIVNYGELFTACQQGTVDGMMTSTGLYVSDRFYEVQKYMGAVNAAPLLHVPLVNLKWYNALSSEQKKAFDESIPLYLEAVRTFEDEYEKAALEELKKRGMQVVEYSPEEKKAFVDAAAYILRDKADIAGEEIIAKIRKQLGK